MDDAPTYAPPPGQAEVVAALRARDEAAFVMLVEELSPSMLRVARMYVSTRAVAEEVVQETWLAVLTGIDGFEGRSSLKTWIFRILANRARTRGARESRTTPMSEADEGSTVDPSRFHPPDHARWPGHWSAAPQPWAEERLLAHETAALVHAAIDKLPPAQREVITLRDVEGFSADEACEALGLTEINQRVLLHRARAKVRAALEEHLKGGAP